MFTMIAGCCKYVEVEDELNCGHEHHDYLLPYVYANKGLKSRYQEIISENKGHRQTSAQTNSQDLQNVLDGEGKGISKFYTSGRPGECANAYDEDTWTTRLFYSLSTGLEGVSGKLFANLREELLPVQL